MNLADRVSNKDMQAIQDKRNPPEYEEGFEPDNGDGGWDNVFDNTGDEFGGFSFDDPADGFEDNNGSNEGDVFSSFSSNSFGDDSFGNNGMNMSGSLALGNNQQNQQGNVPQTKPDLMDKAMDASTEALAKSYSIFKSLITSVSSRTADELGTYFNKIITVSIITGIIGIIVIIASALAGKPKLGIDGLGLSLTIGAGLGCGTGFIGMGSAAMRIITHGEYVSESIDDIANDSGEQESESDAEEYDTNFDDLFSDLFGDGDGEEDEPGECEEENKESNSNEGGLFDNLLDSDSEEEDVKEVDYEHVTDNVESDVRGIIDRKYLFNLFKDYFVKNTPGFSMRKEISPEDEMFNVVETLVIKALASVKKCDITDIKEVMERLVETYFCYEIKFERAKGVKNTDEISKEIEVYFREDSNDEGVVATVAIEGDYYKIVVTKGVNAIVTFGDCFELDEVCEYFLNTKKKLPFIGGIDDFGNPVLLDAKIYTTMLLAGKPRSGKSWYVDSILLALMTFNTPEDVQFLIIDPKESSLFYTIANMPHVCGIHNHKNIIPIFKDIIEKEGGLRKKILKDNKCDDIWELRDTKGIKLPVLYIVVDEFMTVMNSFESGEDKEFKKLMNVIITQLPSQGICLLFVPHRAQGVVDKTSRTNMAFTAAVRATSEVVNETLDIKGWTRSLVQPGDTALKVSDRPKAMFVKGAALTTSDAENKKLINAIAKTFYKMGIDIPDMSTIGRGYNRDEASIRRELMEDGVVSSSRVQYDLDNLDDIKQQEEDIVSDNGLVDSKSLGDSKGEQNANADTVKLTDEQLSSLFDDNDSDSELAGLFQSSGISGPAIDLDNLDDISDDNGEYM